jgi:hypothetical protein
LKRRGCFSLNTAEPCQLGIFNAASPYSTRRLAAINLDALTYRQA